MKRLIRWLTWADLDQAVGDRPLTLSQVFWRFVFSPREGIRSWRVRKQHLAEMNES